MRHTLYLVILLVAPIPALAQPPDWARDSRGARTTIRDSGGRTQYVVTRSRGTTTLRDAQGRTVERARTEYGRRVYRDAAGRTVRTAISGWR